jgi:hypothetical protein
MQDFDFARAPSKTELLVVKALVLLFAMASGCSAVYLWISGGDRMLWGLLGGLAAAFLFMLINTARTHHRALTGKESARWAWFFVVLGAGGIALGLFVPGPLKYKLMFLGPSITFFGAGLAHVRRARQ